MSTRDNTGIRRCMRLGCASRDGYQTVTTADMTDT